jgi:hypothetical protein
LFTYSSVTVDSARVTKRDFVRRGSRKSGDGKFEWSLEKDGKA